MRVDRYQELQTRTLSLLKNEYSGNSTHILILVFSLKGIRSLVTIVISTKFPCLTDETILETTN